MLKDLVVPAHADAKRKVEAIMAEEIQKATGVLAPVAPGPFEPEHAEGGQDDIGHRA